MAGGLGTLSKSTNLACMGRWEEERQDLRMRNAKAKALRLGYRYRYRYRGISVFFFSTDGEVSNFLNQKYPSVHYKCKSKSIY